MGVLALRSPAGIFSVHFGFLHAVGAAAVPRSWHARGHWTADRARWGGPASSNLSLISRKLTTHYRHTI